MLFDELLIKDKSGKFKILKKGEIRDETDVPSRPRPISSLPSSGAPSFYFYPEDEEEIQKLRKKTQEEITKKEGGEGMVEEVIQESGLVLSQELQPRLKSIILSRLKDIRDEIETKYTLMRSPLKGGVGISIKAAEDILKIINRLQSQNNRENLQKKRSEPYSPFSDDRPKREKGGKAEELRTSLTPKMELPRPPKSQPLRPEQSLLPQVQRPMVKEPMRPKMEDVKFVPKTIGPVEELRELTLADFRRWGDAILAKNKIKEKLHNLETESFTKKIQGIDAWYKNEITRFYLRIAAEALKQKKSIAQVINERTQKKEPTLTEAEFKAVIELNQELRWY